MSCYLLQPNAIFIYFGLTKFIWKMYHVTAKSSILYLSSPFLRPFKAAIDDDLTKIKTLGHRKTNKCCHSFRKIGKSSSVDFWLFRHDHYINCSDCTFDDIDGTAQVRIRDVPIVPKCRQNDHGMLLSFYYDNKSLLQMFEEDSSLPFYSNQIKVLRKLLSNSAYDPSCDLSNIYYTSGSPDMLSVRFSENVWTRRLCGGLQTLLPGVEVNYTAEDGMQFANKQESITKLSGNRIQCYLFHGAADITIKQSVIVADLSYDEYHVIENKLQPDNHVLYELC